MLFWAVSCMDEGEKRYWEADISPCQSFCDIDSGWYCELTDSHIKAGKPHYLDSLKAGIPNVI